MRRNGGFWNRFVPCVGRWPVVGASLVLLAGQAFPSRAIEPPVLPIFIADIVSLPFMEQWQYAELDRELDKIAAAQGLSAAARQELGSIPGKFAVWQSIVERTRGRRDAWYRNALAGLDGARVAGAGPAEAARHGVAGLFFPLVRYAAGLQGDVDALGRELKGIADRLRGDSPLEGRLRAALSAPGAAEAVYVSFIYPVYLSRGGAPGFEALFEREASGAIRLRQDARGRAEEVANELASLARAIDEMTGRVTARAERIGSTSSLERAYREALTDPVTAGLIASVRFQRQPEIGASGLAATTERQLFDKLEDAGDSISLAAGVDTRKAESNLDRLYRLRAITHGNATYLEMMLAQASASGGVDDDLRALLSSRFVAASLLPAEAMKPLTEVFRKFSVLGSALVGDGKGGWSVNSHRERELSIALDYLELRLRDWRTHAERLKSIASATRFGLGGGSAPRLAELAAMEIAGITALKDPRPMIDSWRDEYFAAQDGPVQVRASQSAELDRLAGAADKIRSRMKGQVPPIRIGLSDGYVTDGIDLLRSSAYVYLGSKFARETYFNEFEDHEAVRLWGIFDWNAQTAGDAREFREKLTEQTSFLKRVAATHEKVVIYVFHTPRWLSSSRDERQVDGRPAFLLYPPSDSAAWRRFVGDTVDFLAEHLKGVEVYYEFWNEPEIYWPGSTEDFLRLYGETAKAIKARHPEAKVGGATVNGWDGRLKNGGTSEPLNISLIRYVVENGLPLDFIAWHHFERSLKDLEVAKQTYFEALRKLGMERMPELVVSEWSIPRRGSRLEAMLFAEYMLAFYQARLDIQAVSAWDEFSVLPRTGYFAPWGMLTHQNFKKPMYHVHSFFDRLGRGSSGIAVFSSDDGRSQVVVSRKGSGRYELVAWERRYSHRLDAALAVLKDRGVDQTELREFGSVAELENAVRQGEARKSRHPDAFLAAQTAYRSAASGVGYFSLDFAGAQDIVVKDAQAVGSKLVSRQVFTEEGRVATNLERGEVIWISLQVK